MTRVDAHTHPMAHEPLFQFQGDLTPLFSEYKTIGHVGMGKPICPRTSLFSSLLRVCLHF